MSRNSRRKNFLISRDTNKIAFTADVRILLNGWTLYLFSICCTDLRDMPVIYVQLDADFCEFLVYCLVTDKAVQL